MDLATHLQLVPKLRMDGAIVSLFPYCFISSPGTALLYFAVFVTMLCNEVKSNDGRGDLCTVREVICDILFQYLDYFL